MKIKNKLKTILGVKITKIINRLIVNMRAIIFHFIDIIFSPLTIVYAYYFRAIRKRRFENLPICKKILFSVGVFPIIDHYYEPLFNTKKYLHKPLNEKRYLPGIYFNVKAQVEHLKNFNFNNELLAIPYEKENNKIEFCYNVGPFPPADAEYLYNIIRFLQPNKILEVGSGHSTLMAINAINKNSQEDRNYSCEHICIEPYENIWLDKLDIHFVKELVEKCEISLFKQLKKNDILFIDSTHIIRPQGDVLFLFLEVLSQLKSGVIIHIHDIVSPQDIPEEWLSDGNRFWNEQYLLEAFLTCNNEFSIIGSTNYLLYNHYEEFSAVCPVTKSLREKGKFVGAGSFWLKKN